MGSVGFETAAGIDPAEEVGRVAAARRGRLLRLYRRRLRFEDLEDAYSQATLELVARARRSPFDGPDHVANALELRFKSRIEDRRRAIEGRSAIESAIAHAVPVDAPGHGLGELEDRAAGVERQVLARTEMRRLREVIADLTRDQQLVLASQVLVDMEPSEFCVRHAWSIEKYRKVAQRARGKLRVLVEEYERGERCRRLEPDMLALCAGVAAGEALARARAHLANCPVCARTAGEMERAARSVAALLPLPATAGAGGLIARLMGSWGGGVRRAVGLIRHPLAEAGGSGVAGGSLAGAGAALKVGIAAVCVAGAAGGYAACAHLGILAPLGIGHVAHHAVARERPASAHARPRRHGVATTHARRSAGRRLRARAPARFVAGRPTTTVTASTVPASTVPVVSAVAAGRRSPGPGRRRLTVAQQTRLEFGGGAGRPASAAAAGPAPALAAAAARTSRAGAAQVRREFGHPRARAAATVASTATAPGSATAAGAASASGSPGSTGTGLSVATPAPTPPAQSAGQARQTTAEFGFEK